jgi:ribosomal protein S18 acetylase RimI-like enzyme
MEITRLGAGDVDRFREVRLRALADAPKAFASTYEREAAYPRETWAERLTAQGWVHLLAVDGGGPALGMASGRVDPDPPGTGHLLGMWVAPEARGRGVGVRLIEEVAGWAVGVGLTHLILWVTDPNLAARALYERSGFRATGERQPLPSDPSIMETKFVRDLTSAV